MGHAKASIVGIACALAVANGAASGPAAQEREQIVTRSGQRIADKLKPFDKEVTVIDTRENPGLVEPPPGVSWLDWMMHADMILVARLSEQRPFLSETGDHVRSTLSFQVTEILKASSDPRPPLVVGSHFDWEAIGGTVVIGGTTVHVKRPWSDGFKNGARYLILMNVAPPDDVLGGGRLVMGETSFFEIVGNRLVSMAGLRLPSITDVPLPVVMASIRGARPWK